MTGRESADTTLLKIDIEKPRAVALDFSFRVPLRSAANSIGRFTGRGFSGMYSVA
jgi:hypothetical protein